jgi:hypothetical protein
MTQFQILSRDHLRSSLALVTCIELQEVMDTVKRVHTDVYKALLSLLL